VPRPDRSITRNPLILAAGILLMLSGVLGVISIVSALGAGFGAFEVLTSLFWLMLAAVSIFAGWWVLNQQERGRSLGRVLAIVGLASRCSPCSWAAAS
jgi:high-affinity Fe2+/Pb2+ permease